MVYYISDLHFGHENIIKLCSRPFKNIDEMDEELIRCWNEKVTNADRVYIVGDVVWKGKGAENYLPRLKGKKVLIRGNHDDKLLSGGGAKYFEDVLSYAEVREGGRTITLCHYPMVEWRDSLKLGSKKLGWLVFGHIHNNYLPRYRDVLIQPHALNASAEVVGYAPATFDELISFNQDYKLSSLPDLYDKALFLASFYHMYQLDKAGAPYINHPLAVSAMVTGEKEKVVALLHDTLEDTSLPLSLLEKVFPEDIVNCVLALTRREGEDYFSYVRRAAANNLARAVKLADLTNNMDMSRFKCVPEDYARLYERYRAAKELILSME